MSDDFIDKEEQNEENIPTPENGHLDYKPADTKNTGVKHQLSGMYQNWFLDYASYVILERAVPHINDGLKPVQRRILHSMKRLDDGRYNKVANIVGHTMQFHPHGDASIGDALMPAFHQFGDGGVVFAVLVYWLTNNVCNLCRTLWQDRKSTRLNSSHCG